MENQCEFTILLVDVHVVIDINYILIATEFIHRHMYMIYPHCIRRTSWSYTTMNTLINMSWRYNCNCRDGGRFENLGLLILLHTLWPVDDVTEGSTQDTHGRFIEKLPIWGPLFDVNSQPLIDNSGCFLGASWVLPSAAASTYRVSQCKMTNIKSWLRQA